jgi:hypothetical protein
VNGERIRVVHLQEPCRALKQRSPDATIASSAAITAHGCSPRKTAARSRLRYRDRCLPSLRVERAGPLLHGDFTLVVFQRK